jgi:hypothetical protein
MIPDNRAARFKVFSPCQLIADLSQKEVLAFKPITGN